MLAERFGRSPEEVEQWDEYWFNRANEYIQGEAMYQNEQMKSRRKK